MNTPHPSLRRSCLAVLACSALIAQGAFAASASEQANLEVMIRQLNALEDTARRSAQGADEPGQRFYFDYSRLAADLQRIRQGLQDYMTPSRAQPRDPSDLFWELHPARRADAVSMSGAQTSAFQAAAGFPPSAGEGLFIGAAMTFLLLWSAWAMYSTWRGWATNNLDSATAGASAIRILVLLGITSFFLLS